MTQPSLGMIVRADDGGLGVQTWEIAQHMRPDRVLVVQVEPSRGTFRPERYADFDHRVTPQRPRLDDLDWLLACDTVFSVEGFYNEELPARALAAGARLVLLANPELFSAEYRALADREQIDVRGPTDWELRRLGPRAQVLPQPVNTDRLPRAHRTGPARTFLHISAPAMLDRNGTGIVRQAVGLYLGPEIRLLVSGPERPAATTRIGNVTVEPLGDVDDYWERYVPEIDAAVLPRRYGGLSLSAAEALACGIPCVVADRAPDRDWSGTRATLIERSGQHRMKGGRIDVQSASPHNVALRMSWLAEHPEDVEELSGAALCYGDSISWAELQHQWVADLRR